MLTLHRALLISTALLIAGAAGCQSTPPAPEQDLHAALANRRPAPGQMVFASPEAAVEALTQAAGSTDRGALRRIFGPDGDRLLAGDASVEDEELRRFAASIRERHELVDVTSLDPTLVSGRTILALRHGESGRVFPVPLDSFDGRWFFDTPIGVAELSLRHIGTNELRSIAVLRALVDAQREYALIDHDGDGVLAFATRIESSGDRRDGLHWEFVEGEIQLDDGVEGGSAVYELPPVGPRLAWASLDSRGAAAQPYHGYLYRMLVPPDVSEPFVFIAVPAAYRVSGVMTFAVGPDGVVHERDLGPETEHVARSLRQFDRESWVRTEE